ncbi:glycoside hydrolase family 18 protein [Aspergillus thermomutatus]|uniref:chitinase n=1 Tax=Aspergillus thermomutatus TaxID=41047 RepID=A0A397GZQ7_ASPTH|nr:uncharacterized protein CDV56_107798 [Aspergillus thermomutatus]RHZ56167.1 hypothetical protein CDV56_107798 [Aspergillus thermomutatus]
MREAFRTFPLLRTCQKLTYSLAVLMTIHADRTRSAKTRHAAVQTTFVDTASSIAATDPNRPSPGKGGDVRNRVIGYYESWRADGSTCGTMRPEEIPVEYLHQVNLAFVYIDPKTYQIIDMDVSLADDLYSRVANIKTRNPNAKVWLSIGGWTFNDPGVFQPVLSSIAASREHTYTFAGNLMEFMDKYGFDGVDLDWEYPGATERGGRDEDVKNFPEMLRILKDELQGSNRYSKKWGISITLPTSYWYLRWFDIKALESVVDEFNLMAYDLHGVWDELNPIGPIVYAHTNLTEIDLALDLFWRNNISPSKIILGLAFYGRTYELVTPLCATPGCEWRGPGSQGQCTGKAGILSYREIQDMIKEKSLSPKYDEEAGVFYIQYGEGGANWASFDDAISFQAKIDMANRYGLGGVLIWAIDQDDDSRRALQGVTGKDVPPAPSVVDGFGAFSLDQCYMTDCNRECQAGDVKMTTLNSDKSGRGCNRKKGEVRSFCCPAMNAPDASTCHWSSDSADCRGQCGVGEVTMLEDDYGNRCCPATNGQQAIAACEYSPRNKPCPNDKPQELTSIAEYLKIVAGMEKASGAPATNALRSTSWSAKGVFRLLARQRGSLLLRSSSNWRFTFSSSSAGESFPHADSFPSSYNPTFAMLFDNHPDETASSPGEDPNKEAFTWIVMVGEEEDVQSFEKRDGSHLELFDCPNTAEDDFSVQQARAICVGGSLTDNNCEDIMKGGVEGTIVRMPAHCGPDTYVRAVRFERSSNLTLPGTLQKRYAPASYSIYDFHYDYNFQNLRRDGKEIYFRADLSRVASAGPLCSIWHGIQYQGIFTTKPYFQLDVRLEADAYVSAQATVEMSLSLDKFRYYLPATLGSSGFQNMGDHHLRVLASPISGRGDIEARVGGGLLYHFRPTVGFDIKLQYEGKQYVDTSIKLTTDGQIRFDTALSTSCSAGLQVDIAGGMTMDLSVENALPGWKDESYALFSFSPREIFSGCVPFEVLARRELEGNLSNFVTRSDITVPKDTASTCAFSTEGVYCADRDGIDDPDPNCDLSELRLDARSTYDEADYGDDYLADGFEDDGMTRRGVTKRSAKDLSYCDQRGGGEYVGFFDTNKGTIHFRKFPSSTELVRDYNPNAVTYDAEDFLDCNNYELVDIPTPARPVSRADNNGRQYHSEHILEAQTVQRFFNAVGKAWSNGKKTTKNPNPPPNPNARMFTTPLKGKTDLIPWCTYMNLWWNKPSGLKPNDELGNAFPGYRYLTEEFVLYEGTLNSAIKQNWFAGIQSMGQDKIDEDIDNRKWGKVAKTFKLHILGWKYYYFEDNVKTLLKQARRVEKALRKLDDDNGINALVKDNRGNYDKPYIPQGLADLWRTWVEQEHDRVQHEVKAWLEKWVKLAYDRNRPADQSQHLSEAWAEVQNLRDWDINWDFDAMDTDA